VILPTLQGPVQSQRGATEASAGFDNETNGYFSQTVFDDLRDTFEEEEGIAEGLGPVFNDTACSNCHNVPVSGGSSEVLETRAGRLIGRIFVEHLGGSLVQCCAISPAIVEKVIPGEDTTFRASLNVLGDGFVEAIDDKTIEDLARNQPPEVQGMVIYVPVVEANGALRVGRFGWKNQHASLVSFSADAYLNEMGITSPFGGFQFENTSDGNSVAKYDTVQDPEDEGGVDVRKFADFVRSTKVPPRDRSQGQDEGGDAEVGEAIFNKIGCGTCHVGTIVTAPAGTVINGGAFTVPTALGNKAIHPFSDFLLHDIGTDDPIVQNGGPDTYNKVRTVPLWGLRKRTLLMHDGQSTSITDAIRRHSGQAQKASSAFRSLSQDDREKLLVFLRSL
jgi:CxxC motif-containing protein (DUF1111 family)